MASSTDSVMEVAALGRPFEVGMLYDSRADALVPGISLWNHEELQKHITKRPQKYSNFQIETSQTTASKYSSLNVQGSLKLSVKSGMVEVGGSAKYLNSNKTSKNQASVTLKYTATTMVKELSMDHLGSDYLESVFDKSRATHVVTSVLYGANAFLLFHREVSEDENVRDIEGSLKLAIQKIPDVSIEGEGSGSTEDKDLKEAENFFCQFYGDFCLEQNPLTFKDAVNVYQKLPQLLGEGGEYCVPLKVWMVPLTYFDSDAAKLERQISTEFVEEAGRVLDSFTELEMRCNDALSLTATKFPKVAKKIRFFKEMCSDFKLEFQEMLANKLPLIRAGTEEETALAEILRNRQFSPFSDERLNQWMDCKETEIAVLNGLTNMIKNISVISSEKQMYEETLGTEFAVGLVFPPLGYEEPYLLALSDYMKDKCAKTIIKATSAKIADIGGGKWYTEDLPDLIKNVQKFSQYGKANTNVKLLALCVSKKAEHKVHFQSFSHGLRGDFEFPPECVIINVYDITNNCARVLISPPTSGDMKILSYSIEYRKKGETEWQQKTVQLEDVTVDNLHPDTEYELRCRVETSDGAGTLSEPYPFKTMTQQEAGFDLDVFISQRFVH